MHRNAGVVHSVSIDRHALSRVPGINQPMPNRDSLAEFTVRCAQHTAGDEKAKRRFF